MTGAIAAAGSEAIIPVVSQWLYGIKDPEQLTADQKDTLSSIAGLVGAGTGALVGDGVADVVSGSQIGQTVVDNNNVMLQAIFVAKHPLIAKAIGATSKDIDNDKDPNPNISTIASTFQLNLFNKEDFADIYTQEELTGEGGVGNAYRHTLWQALITKEFGENIAIEVGNAHESVFGTNFNQQRNLSLQDADELVDQLNNQIGRSIAKSNPNYSNRQLAERALNEFASKGLYQAVLDKNGTYHVERILIPDVVYQRSKEKLNTLDQTGAGPQIQTNRQNIRNKKK